MASSAMLVASQLVKLAVPWLAGQAIDTLQAGGPDSILRAGWFVALVMLSCVLTWALHGPGSLLSTTLGVASVAGYLVVALIILRFDRALMRLASVENRAERHYLAGMIDFLGGIGAVIALRLPPSTTHFQSFSRACIDYASRDNVPGDVARAGRERRRAGHSDFPGGRSASWAPAMRDRLLL